MKTLLVQDRPDDPVLRQCLLDRGCELVTCRDSPEAKSLVRNSRFDLVVVDLENPAQGEALCQSLPKLAMPSRSLVLLAIDQGTSAPALGMLGSGADDLLSRPYEPRAVQMRLAAIEHQLRQRREWQDLANVLTTHAQQQVAIAALGQCALSEEMPTLIDLVSRFIMYTLDVEFCSLLELSEDGQSMKMAAGFGWREGYLGSVLARPSVESLIGRTLTGEDLIVENLAQDARFGVSDFLREHGVVSGISVAVRRKEKGVFGALGAYTARSRRFVEDELRFLEGLANVLGAAIERNRNEAEIQKHQIQVQHLQRLESVGHLAAGLAHDYNNVLSIIHGHVTLALGAPQLPAAVATSMKRVLEAAERAASLTRQMLSFSRKQSMQLQAVDLNATVASLAKLLDRVLGVNIRLEVQQGVGLPAVQADTGMIDQVLLNLAVNARDAMAGGGKLTISTSVVMVEASRIKQQPEARAGEFVRLAVSDTGCGMDDSTLQRIFDPFFTTKPPGKGSGLGLSTVYGIIKQHQGWVEVESAPGKGTTFSVFFPSLRQPLPASETPPIAGHASTETILLVEDEPTVRELAKLLLETLGYQVHEAGSGVEALQVWEAQKENVRVLLTDLIMPDGITGFELAERLQHQQPHLKVIFTSGYSADVVSQNLPGRRGFQFVQKPYRTETLAKALHTCLAT